MGLLQLITIIGQTSEIMLVISKSCERRLILMSVFLALPTRLRYMCRNISAGQNSLVNVCGEFAQSLDLCIVLQTRGEMIISNGLSKVRRMVAFLHISCLKW